MFDLICENCKKQIQIPKIEEKNYTIYNADAKIALDYVNTKVDAIITDPPYNSGSLNPREILRDTKEKYTDGTTNIPNFYLDSVPEDFWTQEMVKIFTKANKLLKGGGLFAVFIDWRKLNKMVNVLLISGLTPKGVIVWNKTAGARPIKSGFRNQCEFILWGRKEGNETNPPKVYLEGIVTKATLTNNKLHQTQKPVEVIEFILKATNEKDTILDPFMGSGTTGVACLKNKRKFIGIEIMEEFFKIAHQRLKEVSSYA